MNQQPSNRLGDAISPYLLQHAGNPVAWQPWDREALAMARTLDKPILLSIGYSACHWCHVMARECFENDEIAERMNAFFVAIKVDREERPDLDHIYQLAHQLLTGRGGGWPLTVFLDPASHAPFFAGTYFPPEPRHGMMAFGDLLERIHQVWSTRREELRAQHLQVHEALQAVATPRPGGESDLESALEPLVAEAGARFDRDNGGFGEDGPKFPQAPLLAALAEVDGGHPAQMLGDSLAAMARLGLHDQLGGGFFRYCVDAVWEIPHFEKMLSDNALLLGLYARAARRWQRADFRAVCIHLVEWLEREMALEGGGFATSLNAESADGEGAYYVWTRKEVAERLPAGEHDLFSARFGLDGPANFENQYWHLVIARSTGELVEEGLDEDEIARRLESARRRLLEARAERPAPSRDDKMLASWNGLMIENLAVAGRLLGREDWRERAARALDTTAVNLFGQEPPRAVWRDGRSAQTALLDEHANMLIACLELLSWRFEIRWLNLARRIARRIVAQFVDEASGALHLTPRDYESLLTRPLAHADDATPAGAGQAAIGLVRLGQLCGEPALIDTAQRAVAAARGDIERSAMAHATLLRAWRALEHPRGQILLAGPDAPVAEWQRKLEQTNRFEIYRLPAGLAAEDLPELLAPLAGERQATAMVCLGQRCLPPVHSLGALEAQLAEANG